MSAPLEDLHRAVEERGWLVVTAPMSDELPEATSTVGLTARGLPELAVVGLGHDTGGALLHEVASRLAAGQVLGDGEPVTGLVDGGADPCLDEPVRPHVRLPAADLYGDDVLVRQLVWADAQGRLPGDDGFAHTERQPLVPGDPVAAAEEPAVGDPVTAAEEPATAEEPAAGEEPAAAEESAAVVAEEPAAAEEPADPDPLDLDPDDDLPREWPLPHDPHTPVLTSRPAAVDGLPVLMAYREADGGWLFVDGVSDFDEASAVQECLHDALERDLGLIAVAATLQAGDMAQRDAPGTAWRYERW